MQGFREYFGLGFFQGLLKDSKKMLVRLGHVHAGRVMKFTSVKEIKAKASTIKACVHETIAAEKAGLQLATIRGSLNGPTGIPACWTAPNTNSAAFGAVIHASAFVMADALTRPCPGRYPRRVSSCCTPAPSVQSLMTSRELSSACIIRWP